jgi:Relaxase/Mobilisation nuclease domain
MVKINSSRGRSAHDLVSYILNPEKQLDRKLDITEVISTNMFGRSALELAQEFTFFSDLNPRVQRIMTHYSVSLPPGESLDFGLMDGLTSELLSLMGHDGLYFAARHYDQEHLNDVKHFHVAAASSNFDGSWVSDSFDRLTLKSIERQLEQSFGLSSPVSSGKSYLTTGEYRRKRRTDELLPKERLWNVINKCAADLPSFPLFVARLGAQDVQVRFRVDDNSGDISGVSFAIDDSHFRGGQLGKQFSFYGLQQHLGVSFAAHQVPELLQLQTMAAGECRALLDRREHLQSRYLFWQEQSGSDIDSVVASFILEQQPDDFPCLSFSPSALALYHSFGKAAQFDYLRQLLDNRSQVKDSSHGSVFEIDR